MLKVQKFPCPKQLQNVTENVLSVDLGRHVGFAYINNGILYCGSYILKTKQWRFYPPILRQVNNYYKEIIDALLLKNKIMTRAIIQDNIYLFKQKYIKGRHQSYYKKLQMITEGLFCLNWHGTIRRYFGGTLKKKHFGSAQKKVVKDRIKKMLNVTRMCDHTTDSIAGLFAVKERSNYV